VAAEPTADNTETPSGAARRRRRKALVNMRDVRPAWELPAWARSAIASAFPSDWEVHFVESAVDGRGDGSGASAEAIEAAPGTEVYLGLGAPREIFMAATAGPAASLRWIHTGTAGVASLLYPELVESDVILTNSAGVHAPAIAETVTAMMLHFARGLDSAIRSQAARRWDTAVFAERTDMVTELQGSTVGILGLGGIGREVARRALALGMRVLATRRSGRPAAADIDLFTGPHATQQVLELADFVVVALPSTASTRGLLDRETIDRIKHNAVLINVARGDIIDESALIDALRDGRLRGAALDAFQVEPLPADSGLWDLPNVLITPHVSATTPRFWLREVELIRENVARYLAGRGLLNVVDRKLGY
jgi:phosphoglycerate dehydrogenase-like enzyme